jgi:hypothetical protein
MARAVRRERFGTHGRSNGVLAMRGASCQSSRHISAKP